MSLVCVRMHILTFAASFAILLVLSHTPMYSRPSKALMASLSQALCTGTASSASTVTVAGRTV